MHLIQFLVVGDAIRASPSMCRLVNHREGKFSSSAYSVPSLKENWKIGLEYDLLDVDLRDANKKK